MVVQGAEPVLVAGHFGPDQLGSQVSHNTPSIRDKGRGGPADGGGDVHILDACLELPEYLLLNSS